MTTPAPQRAGTATSDREIKRLAKALRTIRDADPVTYWAISGVILEVEKKSPK
jgi:hypothetical protein